MVEKQEIAVESAHWEGAALRHLLVPGQPQPALKVPNTGIYKLLAGMGTPSEVPARQICRLKQIREMTHWR